MRLEHKVDDLIGHLERQEHDPWGQHARHISHEIHKSGLPALLGRIDHRLNDVQNQVRASGRAIEAEVRASGEAVTSAVTALAAVTSEGFDQVCRSLAAQTQVLSRIEQLLANPLSTAAAERYRRGLHALNEGWHDDAVRELKASIEQDRFQALYHYSLGLALGALGRDNDALSAFESAVKYSGSDRALDPVAAGAALLAAQVAGKLHGPKRREAILESAIERSPDCAELHLALAQSTADTAQLRQALMLAPELALTAVIVEIPGARDVAEDVHRDPEGPVQNARKATELARTIGVDTTFPSEAPAAMTGHNEWRTTKTEEIRRAAERATQEAEARNSELRALRDKTSPSKDDDIPTKQLAAVFAACAVVEVWAVSELAEQSDLDITSFPFLVATLAGIAGGYSGFWLLVLGLIAFADAVWEMPARLKRRREHSKKLAAAADQASAADKGRPWPVTSSRWWRPRRRDAQGPWRYRCREP